jgi:hypothetical protein
LQALCWALWSPLPLDQQLRWNPQPQLILDLHHEPYDYYSRCCSFLPWNIRRRMPYQKRSIKLSQPSTLCWMQEWGFKVHFDCNLNSGNSLLWICSIRPLQCARRELHPRQDN